MCPYSLIVPMSLSFVEWVPSYVFKKETNWIGKSHICFCLCLKPQHLTFRPSPLSPPRVPGAAMCGCDKKEPWDVAFVGNLEVYDEGAGEKGAQWKAFGGGWHMYLAFNRLQSVKAIRSKVCFHQMVRDGRKPPCSQVFGSPLAVFGLWKWETPSVQLAGNFPSNHSLIWGLSGSLILK